jgi:hypothetical protein
MSASASCHNINGLDGAGAHCISHPPIELSLQFLPRAIDILAERHARELVQHGFVRPFPNPVRPEMPCLRAGLFDLLLENEGYLRSLPFVSGRDHLEVVFQRYEPTRSPSGE